MTATRFYFLCYQNRKSLNCSVFKICFFTIFAVWSETLSVADTLEIPDESNSSKVDCRMHSMFLMLLYVVYLLIGAKVFQLLEKPTEVNFFISNHYFSSGIFWFFNFFDYTYENVLERKVCGCSSGCCNQYWTIRRYVFLRSQPE